MIVVRRLGEDGRYHVAGTAMPEAPLKVDEPFAFRVDVERLVG